VGVDEKRAGVGGEKLQGWIRKIGTLWSLYQDINADDEPVDVLPGAIIEPSPQSRLLVTALEKCTPETEFETDAILFDLDEEYTEALMQYSKLKEIKI
jgi:hypothetical protein